MISVRMFVACGVSGVLLGTIPPAYAQSAAAPAAIQQQLLSLYNLTKATADGTDVVTAGAVVVLQKDNLLMCRVNLPIPTPNVYKNGAIDQEGLLGALGRMGTGPQPGGGPPNTRKFVTGEKFFVTKIEVQKDGVAFQVLSDPFQDMRYHAVLKFPFAKQRSRECRRCHRRHGGSVQNRFRGERGGLGGSGASAGRAARANEDPGARADQGAGRVDVWSAGEGGAVGHQRDRLLPRYESDLCAKQSHECGMSCCGPIKSLR